MKKKNLLFFSAIFILPFLIALIYNATLPQPPQAQTITAPAVPRLTVLLVPLDSRPPCAQFSDRLAAIADIKIILPPPEIMDHYKKPANKAALRAWLKESASQADAVIVSADMLIHGGLLASRLSLGTPQDAAATLNLLAELRRQHPGLKIYAFNIIPRLIIADNDSNSWYQNKMLKYSVLEDQFLTFDNPDTFAQINKLEKEIPPDIIKRYLALNEANVEINKKLIDLAKQKVLDGLVIGQDDGQPFGLPNVSKKRIDRYLHSFPELAEKVFITRGTDEVAISLLGRIAQEQTAARPKVYIQYSHWSEASLVMPFMPHSIAKTVSEKIAVAGCTITESRDNADFILYVHAGTQKTSTAELILAARELKHLIESGYNVALIDLSEDYYGHEALLPYLLNETAPIHRLIAYAGWNTTSNSIGTAITQACLFNLSEKTPKTREQLLRTYKYNLEFLTARVLDDWYYQKDVQAVVKKHLQQLRIDGNNLAANYPQVNNYVKSLLTDRANTLSQQALIDKTIPLRTENGPAEIIITSFRPEFALPWERIFEVQVDTDIALSIRKTGQ